MHVEELDFRRASDEVRRELYALSAACHENDAPPSRDLIPYEGWVTGRLSPDLGFDLPHTLIAREGGQVVGTASVRLSEQDENAHVAMYGMGVHPRWRRRGIGKALLRAALPLMEGRTIIECRLVYHDSDGQKFATARGFRTSMAWTVQRQNLTGRPEIGEVPAGYELVTWTGAVPEEHLAAYLTGVRSMSDAPSDDFSINTTQQTAESVRADHGNFLDQGGDVWVVLALHDGEIAGLTELRRFKNEPDVAFQFDTVVTRAHRGKGLGLLIKKHMLHQLPPEVVRVETQTNATNEHMRRVNRALGYEDLYTYSSVNAQIADLRL